MRSKEGLQKDHGLYSRSLKMFQRLAEVLYADLKNSMLNCKRLQTTPYLCCSREEDSPLLQGDSQLQER